MRSKLVTRQRDLGLTDQQMADLMGMPRTTWASVKNGNYRVSLSVAKKAVVAFPDLAPYVLLDEPVEPK